MSTTTSLPLTAADLVCVDDVDPFASETQSDLESLEQDVLHLLEEDYSSNPDDPDRGIGLANVLSRPSRSISDVTRLVESQLAADDRIDQVKATLTAVPAGYSFPSGLTFDTDGWVLDVQIVVDGSLLGLTYAYSPATGVLVP